MLQKTRMDAGVTDDVQIVTKLLVSGDGVG